MSTKLPSIYMDDRLQEARLSLADAARMGNSSLRLLSLVAPRNPSSFSPSNSVVRKRHVFHAMKSGDFSLPYVTVRPGETLGETMNTCRTSRLTDRNNNVVQGQGHCYSNVGKFPREMKGCRRVTYICRDNVHHYSDYMEEETGDQPSPTDYRCDSDFYRWRNRWTIIVHAK